VALESRTLKIVVAARERRRGRLDAEMLRQRRRLQEAQASHSQAVSAVNSLAEEAQQLLAKRDSLLDGPFSTASLLAMDSVHATAMDRVKSASEQVTQALTAVEREREAVRELAQQLARNQRQVDAIKSRIVMLDKADEEAAEEAEAEEVEETALAAATARLTAGLMRV
jgi:chromosome segregation ATPase